MNANVSIPLLDTWREKRSRERSAAGVGGPPARGRGTPTVRSPHSTDNVTFFNPRFTLFAPPSAAGGRLKTVKVRLLSLFRAHDFASRKRRRDKDKHRENGVENPRDVLRVAREGCKREGGASSIGRDERREEDMSAVESALDVLSRAATMMQGQFTPFEILFHNSFRGSRLPPPPPR